MYLSGRFALACTLSVATLAHGNRSHPSDQAQGSLQLNLAPTPTNDPVINQFQAANAVEDLHFFEATAEHKTLKMPRKQAEESWIVSAALWESREALKAPVISDGEGPIQGISQSLNNILRKVYDAGWGQDIIPDPNSRSYKDFLAKYELMPVGFVPDLSPKESTFISTKKQSDGYLQFNRALKLQTIAREVVDNTLARTPGDRESNNDILSLALARLMTTQSELLASRQNDSRYMTRAPATTGEATTGDSTSGGGSGAATIQLNLPAKDPQHL